MPSIAPAERRLFYIGTMTSNVGTFYLDLAKDLSVVNRRAYSQGMTYYVQQFEHYNIFADNEIQAMSCATAGDTWVVHNSWTKGEAHWNGQQRRARRLIGMSAKPKYEDFKVYLDDTHRAGGTGAATGDELSCSAADGALVSAGQDWDH